MNWKQHIIVGLLINFVFIFSTYLLKLIEYNFLTLILSVPIIIYFSILPDIDHRISKMTGIMLFFATFLIVLGYILDKYFIYQGDILLLGIVILIFTIICSSKYVKHRGIIHTLEVALISPILIYPLVKFNPEYVVLYLIAFISFWSHLIADSIPFKVRF